MDEQDRRIHLLETIRKLDYEIIDSRHSDPEIASKLQQEREELRRELNQFKVQAA